MPAVVSDDYTSASPASLRIRDLDPKYHLKAAGDCNHANGAVLERSTSVTNQGSLDESSNLSTHDSDVSDSAPMPTTNNNGTRPTTMSSLTNSVTAAKDVAAPRLADADANHATNGDPLSDHASLSCLFPDLANHLLRGESPPSSPVKSTALTHAASAALLRGPPEQHQASEPVAGAPAVLHAEPADEEPASHRTASPQASPTTQTSHQHDLVPPRASPQRFSSPPAYQPTSLQQSSSSALQQLPAPTSGLKHRHTLEVPHRPQAAAAAARRSRDGVDSTHSTGRFSSSIAGSIGTRRASLSLIRRATRSMQPDLARDELAAAAAADDDDSNSNINAAAAARWNDSYRQRKAGKRRRRTEDGDDRVLVGTKVDETHANWVTAYNMLTGIRVSVSRTNAKLDRELTDADFQAKQKSTFDITGNELVPSAKYDFKFKDYAPWVFRRLRNLFRLDPADYLISLTGKYILSELGSPGKSGSFFYFSRDYKYIIKTIHHSEHKFLRRILKEYFIHVQDNPNTLLSQFYGLHRVKMPYGKKIHFVVMNNLFPPHRDIHTTFDLKGSTVGRDYQESDLRSNPRATLKDLNWLSRQQHLELGIRKKRVFLDQLQRDVILLKRLQIMDYSLLVGIHDLSRGNEENLRDKTLQVFNPGGEKPTDEAPSSALLRTPSKLKSSRNARELRQMVRQERPVPIGQALDRMSDELGENHGRAGFVFNQDDGGFQATHENNSPADVVYYLGVIDCLTHYGLIKKIEHFWKGLSHDRKQISALPPDQYGDRFYNFVEGITMSAEEAHREAQRRDEEAQASERAGRRSLTLRSPHGVLPMSSPQQATAHPDAPSSPQGRETVEMASKEARRKSSHGPAERDIPDRTLKTEVAGDKRASTQPDSVLPVVEEASESCRNDVTPPQEMSEVTLEKEKTPLPRLPGQQNTVPTATRSALAPSLAPLESADSGYGGNGSANIIANAPPTVRSKLSRDSLNKELPLLPTERLGARSSDVGTPA